MMRNSIIYQQLPEYFGSKLVHVFNVFGIFKYVEIGFSLNLKHHFVNVSLVNN